MSGGNALPWHKGGSRGKLQEEGSLNQERMSGWGELRCGCAILKTPAGEMHEVDTGGIPRAANCWAVSAQGAGRATRHASPLTEGACTPEALWQLVVRPNAV